MKTEFIMTNNVYQILKKKLNYKQRETRPIYTEFNMLLSTISFEYTLIA